MDVGEKRKGLLTRTYDSEGRVAEQVRRMSKGQKRGSERGSEGAREGWRDRRREELGREGR